MNRGVVRAHGCNLSLYTMAQLTSDAGRLSETTKTLENGEGKDYGKARELVPESRGNRQL
jgi:hypothetical protein